MKILEYKKIIKHMELEVSQLYSKYIDSISDEISSIFGRIIDRLYDEIKFAYMNESDYLEIQIMFKYFETLMKGGDEYMNSINERVLNELRNIIARYKHVIEDNKNII